MTTIVLPERLAAPGTEGSMWIFDNYQASRTEPFDWWLAVLILSFLHLRKMAFVSSQSSGEYVFRALRNMQISTNRQDMLIFDDAATSRAVSYDLWLVFFSRTAQFIWTKAFCSQKQQMK